MISIQYGFETIGNATLITHEANRPLLATDVWFDEHPCYFGSWSLPYKVPLEQRLSIQRCPYIYISHFHPDHLNLPSLRNLKNSTILLAQHWGSRVERDLRNAGFTVIALPSKKWHHIGNNTKIMILKNSLQDSALLIEITDSSGHKHLIANLNDSGGIEFQMFIRSIAQKYEQSFYLGLHGFGDADMINLFDKSGARLNPIITEGRQIGAEIQDYLNRFNLKHAIPFSSFHQYQRQDSFWANNFTTPLSCYSVGFRPTKSQSLLPAFIQVHLNNGSFRCHKTNPDSNKITIPISEHVFGDDWNDTLSQPQIDLVREYFHSIHALTHTFSKIDVCIGNQQHNVFTGSGSGHLMFKAPCASFMRAIRTNIFDDLLIGNFMRVYLSNVRSLYQPNFNYPVTKYADNGGVRSHVQLKSMFSHYNTEQSKSDFLLSKLRQLKRFLGQYLI